MTASAQRRTPFTPRAALVALAAVAALAAGLLAPAPAPAAKRLVKPSALPAFPSCASLLSYARTNARRTGGRTGVPTRAGVLLPLVLDAPFGPDVAVADSPTAPSPSVAGAPALSAPPAAEKAAVPEFSQTNVQEAGVDEPDIVKTDGKTVFAVAQGKLHAVDVRGADPQLVGTLDLADGYGHQLLIRGDRLLVVSNALRRRLVLGGDVIISSSQRRDQRDRHQQPGRDDRAPHDDAGGRARRRAADRRHGARRRQRLAGLHPARGDLAQRRVRSFVPRTVLKSNLSGKTFRRSVVACDDVRHPRRFSGLDLLTVLTIDLDKGLFNVDRDAIMAGAQTVYASTTGLYVASQRYVRGARGRPHRARAQPHRHPPLRHLQARPDELRRLGQRGRLRAQPVLHVGVRRRAARGLDGGPGLVRRPDRADSESYVSVLAEHGRSLDLVGRADGLGRGERIYAVRFVGDKGYVVTFRQVDPLYTLDLSKKTDPRVVGELKILGYSAYLHPISDDLLLGVGQDATAQGRTTGTQLSLFDVSDPRNPARKAGVSLEGRQLGRRVRPARVPVLEAGEPRGRAAVGLRRPGPGVRGRDRLQDRHGQRQRSGPDHAPGAVGERPGAADRPLARHRRPALHAVLRRAGVQPPGHAGAAVLRDVPAGAASPRPDRRSRCRARFRSRRQASLSAR